MTEFQANASKEAQLVKKYLKINKAHQMKPIDVVKTVNKSAKHFKDEDGNHIYEFFIQNGEDNHNLDLKHPEKLTDKDVHGMLIDMLKALKVDTKTMEDE